MSKNAINKAELSLLISEIGGRGDGTGMLDGQTVYVPKTAPGDVARIKIISKNREGITAKLVSLETSGPDRVEAPCPHYARCGGCALQHVSESFYRNWKTEKVRTALSRAGITVQEWRDPVFLPAATRRRATFSARKTQHGVQLGYNEGRSHTILDIASCMVLQPDLDHAAQALRPFLPDLLPDNKPADIMVQMIGTGIEIVLSGDYRTRGKFTLAQQEAMAALSETLKAGRISFREKDFGPVEILLQREKLRHVFGALTVEPPPAAFLQPSIEGEQILAELVTDYVGSATNIADLFSGCGTFSGYLCAEGKTVHAVEADGKAIDSIRNGALIKGKLSAEKRNLFTDPLNSRELQQFDAVVFDPPRAGAKEQAAVLALSDIPRIIGVSCNPATFVRDARLLQDGGYTLRSAALVDQFYGTAHVEIVGLFEQ